MGGDLFLFRQGLQIGEAKTPWCLTSPPTEGGSSRTRPPPSRRTSAEFGMVPFGQKKGEISFSVSCELDPTARPDP